MPTIKLQSSDGEIFEVDVEIAKQSVTIKTMLEGTSFQFAFTEAAGTETTYLRVYIRLFGKAFDLWHLWPTDLGMDDDGDDDPVPLPNVNAAILKKVRRTPKPGLLLHGSSLNIHLLQRCPAHPSPNPYL